MWSRRVTASIKAHNLQTITNTHCTIAHHAINTSSRVSHSYTSTMKAQRRIFSSVATTPLTETVRDFLEPQTFYSMLLENNMDFFSGVPDSLLKDFCAYVQDVAPPHKHIIAANEGASIGIAAGHYLATGNTPVVYMQNSGFGNIINPLLSLCAPGVYGVPMLLLIGWRGEPGKKDEPQHMVQGKMMTSLLTDLQIHYEVLPDYAEGAKDALELAMHSMQLRSAPYAFLVKRQSFSPYSSSIMADTANKQKLEMTREEAIDVITKITGKWDVVVCTTGFASRELFELRVNRGEVHSRDFLTVGSMGHASAIALGIAVSKPSRQVYCIDGDGALLMHMGTTASIGKVGCSNFRHVLINNGVHDSVGAQPTGAFDFDFIKSALAMGYKEAIVCETKTQLMEGMKKLTQVQGPTFMEVRCQFGARANLGRPTTTTHENKEEFMKFLAD